MQKRYKGLSNIGATCYMNSLLQTLFMAPQFRYSIYKWKYNPKIHPKQNDSILFQLQILFGKLQTEFPNEISTKQLVKSFQWQDQQAQMQQDIQQFNRILFEALEKSISTKNEPTLSSNFVKTYFEGQLVHYTKCNQCNNESARQQFFQDLIITVKNIYQKVYNGSLELGFQRYLKPQHLDADNLYECTNCNKKTKAERGARFIKMPHLLNIILQRFTFNYFTMEREKVNDKVEFPFILNFNDYIHGYQQIPNKLNEDSSEYFKFANENTTYNKPKSTSSKPLSSGSKSINSLKKKTTPSIAGKTSIKQSVGTKSFLAQMRKRKQVQQGHDEDLFFVSGNATLPPQDLQMGKSKSMKQNDIGSPQLSELRVQKTGPKSQAQINPIIQDDNQLGLLESIKESQRQRSGSNKSNEVMDGNSQDTTPKKDSQQDMSPTEILIKKNTGKVGQSIAQSQPFAENSSILPPPPELDIVPGNLSVPYKMPSSDEGKKTLTSQLQQKILEKQRLDQQKQKNLLQFQDRNKQLIEKYLQSGPLVYELYAVMVHNGTANLGHYYSYVKSFENGRWYSFNDERVNEINVKQIEKTFGEKSNSNAYALHYRMVNGPNEQEEIEKLKEAIPQYILKKIQEQKTSIKQRQHLKVSNLQNLVTLKIYYQLYVKQLQVYKFNCLDLVKQKARQMFNISIQKQNMRLRIFNPVTEAKLETFGGREDLTLEELKIGSFKSLLLEIKKDDEVFEQYEVGAISLRVALLEENKNLTSLDENQLKLHKVSIKRYSILKQIVKVISEKRKAILSTSQNQQISLIKKHQNNDESIHQILNNQQNEQKNMDDLTILENEILFVEPSQPNLVWPQEFQNQIYRIAIKYNKPPGSLNFENYQTDSRLTTEQLKNELCVFLQQQPDDLIMKWGTKSGRQLKDLSLSLKQARFITGTQVYFDYGIPAKVGQIRIQLYLSKDADVQIYNRLHEFQYITDVPISGSLKSSQVKERFSKVLLKFKGIDIKPQQFRIRERVSDKIGKIYRQRPMKQQQLIEKRQIAIELIHDQNLDVKQFSIYIRIWDQQNWKLSKKFQIVVNKNTTIRQIAQILSVEPNNNILNNPQAISFCRILSIHKFNIIDLTAMEWFEMNLDLPVIGEPMFVNADGLLYIVKDSNKQPRALTKQQQAKFGGTIKPAVIRNGCKTYRPKQAKGMKITVIQKQNENLSHTEVNEDITKHQ